MIQSLVLGKKRAAQWARRFGPILWARLRDDFVDPLKDAFFISAKEERAGPVVREVLGALTDDLIHNYRARHTRIALEEAAMLCAIREKKDSLIPEKTETAGEGLRRAVDELVDLLAEDIHSTEKEKQETAQGLLSHVGDLAFPVFMKIVLNTRDRALRSLAAERLQQCGVAGARALASQLNMGNTTNALLNVVSVLGKVGGDEILDGLGTLLRYPDPDLRHAVVRILARLPGDKCSELALKFLGDGKESIRRLAADILGDRKYLPAVSSLLSLLSQPSVEEAETVCVVLGRIGDPVAAEPLGRVLKDRVTLFSKTRVPAYSPYAVAEHAVALLLALNRKIHRAYNRVREMNFSLAGHEGFDLHGKTVGIMGTGRIGRIAAKILKGFGMRVLAFDLNPDLAWAKSEGVEYTDIHTLARESDVVSLHLPLTPESKHMVRAETLKLMKPGSILINVSRGALIDTTALIAAIKSGQLGGVGLDVYEEEEGVFFEDLSGQIMKDDELARLLTFPNVLITAHQAFLTHEALAEISRVTVHNILAWSEGKPFLEGTVLVPGRTK